MKKAILLAAAAVTLATGAKAQGIGFGIEAGVNMASQHNKNDFSGTSISQTSDMKIGLRAGVVVDLGVTANFSVQPGVVFSQMGGKTSGSIGGVSYSTKGTYDYVQIPVNAIYNFSAGPGKLFVGAGPYAAIAVSGTVNDGTTSTKVDFSSAGDAKRFDVGVDALVGYKLPIGVYIKAGYNYGLGNISRTPSGATYTDKTNNMGFMFMVGYMFGK